MRCAMSIGIVLAACLVASPARAQEPTSTSTSTEPTAAATTSDTPAAEPVAPPVTEGAMTPVIEGAAPPATDAAMAPIEAAPKLATEHAAEHAAAAEHEGTAEHGSGEKHEEEGGGENYLPKIVNFIIFAAALVFFAGKPIAAFFGDRRKGIEESFAKAELAQADSARKVAEMEQRFASLEAQVKEILARATEQAEAERQAILESARGDAQKILAQTEAQVADLEAASVRRLKAMAADLAVEAAREIIETQLKPEDRTRLFDRTLKGLSKVVGQ